MIDIENSTDQELVNEYEICQQLWGKYSCDSFGYYLSALQKEISKRNVFLLKPVLEFKYSKNSIKEVTINNTVDFFDKP